ncbi:MAG: nucleoside-diphosphate sugar epimerase [Rickettsiales bacterium]|nr:nucleoside-diphosphate sugar epimerase [Rickettsiales bacterium]
MKKVLLTGVTGFLGSHTTIQLLEKGYHVTGTLRNMSRADSMREVIAKHTSKVENLAFAEADLEDESIWLTLCKDKDFVMHIASPFPRKLPKNDDELIRPAKAGVLNVLNASSKLGVKRVVITSSTGAVVYGNSKGKHNEFTESDWTDVSNKKDTTPYFRSKTIAEKAAWDFIEQDNSGLELVTVCPGAILGPVLEQDFGTSANIVIKALDGSSPALPNIGFDMVDVRSVADLHVRAMENALAANQRYIGSSGFSKFSEVADVLRKAYPTKKVPKVTLPDFMVRLFSNFDKTLKPILIDLSAERRVNHSKAVNELGWKPLSNEEAILSCARSVISHGIVQ